MNYDNFELWIESKQKDVYPVIARSESQGDERGALSLDPADKQVAGYLKGLADGVADIKALQEFGAFLYERLFQKDIGILFHKSLGHADGDDLGVRIRLSVTPPELAALPWELLYDERKDCFLATSGETPLTRYVELSEPIRELKTKPPIKMLVVIPAGTGLDVEKEKSSLLEALAGLGAAIKIDTLEGGATRTAISRALVEETYHIFHFIGHGSFQNDKGYLTINAEDDEDPLISADAFAGFFRDYPWLKLVVLNSCQGAEVSATRPLTGVATQLVRRGVPAVVAMQFPIADPCAILLVKEFYFKLCRGWNRGRVDAAIAHARNRLHMDFCDSIAFAFATPVLFMRSKTGIIFDLEEPPRVLPSSVKQVHLLQEVKKTYDHNITLLEEQKKDASEDVAQQLGREIAEEKRQAADVRSRIRRWYMSAGGLLAASLLVLLASSASLFELVFSLDDRTAMQLRALADSNTVKPFDNKNIAIILVDKEAPPGKLPAGRSDSSHRQYHAGLIEALSGIAKVLVFDMKFISDNGWDKEFSAAIEQAEKKGTKIIVGAEHEEGGPAPSFPARLENSLRERWGIMTGGEVRGTGRFVELAHRIASESSTGNEDAEQPVIPSLALQAIRQFKSTSAPPDAYFAPRERQIRLRGLEGQPGGSIPVTEEMHFILDLADKGQQASASLYHEVYEQRAEPRYLSRFQGKIVLIGYKVDDEWAVASDETRYGVEMHANAISNILLGIYVRPLFTAYNYLLIVLLMLVGAVLQLRFKNWTSYRLPLKIPSLVETEVKLPVALLVVALIYLFCAVLAYKYGRVLFDITYHVTALLLGYWLSGAARRKLGLT